MGRELEWKWDWILTERLFICYILVAQELIRIQCERQTVLLWSSRLFFHQISWSYSRIPEGVTVHQQSITCHTFGLTARSFLFLFNNRWVLESLVSLSFSGFLVFTNYLSSPNPIFFILFLCSQDLDLINNKLNPEPTGGWQVPEFFYLQPPINHMRIWLSGEYKSFPCRRSFWFIHELVKISFFLEVHHSRV